LAGVGDGDDGDNPTSPTECTALSDTSEIAGAGPTAANAGAKAIGVADLRLALNVWTEEKLLAALLLPPVRLEEDVSPHLLCQALSAEDASTSSFCCRRREEASKTPPPPLSAVCLRLELLIEEALAEEQAESEAISLTDSVRLCSRIDANVRELDSLVAGLNDRAKEGGFLRAEVRDATAYGKAKDIPAVTDLCGEPMDETAGTLNSNAICDRAIETGELVQQFVPLALPLEPEPREQDEVGNDMEVLLPCASRYPVHGDLVMGYGDETRTSNDVNGNKDAWKLFAAEVAIVTDVDADGDFQLCSPHGLLSEWMFRENFVFKSERQEAKAVGFATPAWDGRKESFEKPSFHGVGSMKTHEDLMHHAGAADSPEPLDEPPITQSLESVLEERLARASQAQAERHAMLEQAVSRLAARLDPVLKAGTGDIATEPGRLERLETKVRALAGRVEPILRSMEELDSQPTLATQRGAYNTSAF